MEKIDRAGKRPKGVGGWRPGAGRKPVGQAPKIDLKIVPITTTPSGAPLTLSERAKRYADLALETLATICAEGASEAARVSASRELLDRAYGTPGPAEPKVSKKEGASEGAKMAGVGSKWGDDLHRPGAAAN
jgi:hypothetical protein